jgi:hypothetical protein
VVNVGKDSEIYSYSPFSFSNIIILYTDGFPRYVISFCSVLLSQLNADLLGPDTDKVDVFFA